MCVARAVYGVSHAACVLLPHSSKRPIFRCATVLPSTRPRLPHSQLWGVDVNTMGKKQLVVAPNSGDTEENLSLEEKLRRERQRLHATGVTSFFWTSRGSTNIRIMVPLQVSIKTADRWMPFRCPLETSVRFIFSIDISHPSTLLYGVSFVPCRLV